MKIEKGGCEIIVRDRYERRENCKALQVLLLWMFIGIIITPICFIIDCIWNVLPVNNIAFWSFFVPMILIGMGTMGPVETWSNKVEDELEDDEDEPLVSNCCGDTSFEGEDIGICPTCKEHCEYVKEGEM